MPGAEPAPIWAAGAPAGPPPGVPAGAGPAPARRSSRLKLGIVAGVSAVIVIAGGVAVAQAATGNNTNATQDGRGPGGGGRGGYGFPGGGPGGTAQGGPGGQGGQGNGQDNQGGRANGFPGGGFGRGGTAIGIGGALHGDFVIKDGNGQYVTERLQTGTVTAVSATSITAKSEDGHATTFTVGASTKVNNGEANVSDVKSGDTVTIVGTVSGDTATATEITDIALLRQGTGGNRTRPSARPTRTT
ncbi:hypothetical protein [Dactylosporangium sp. CA-092794]|uniref:hypothetical protein n=1 Tax=Dactylosporangium sp. CA-092794 TaxID=3239929 RepID=UPI003D93F722